MSRGAKLFPLFHQYLREQGVLRGTVSVVGEEPLTGFLGAGETADTVVLVRELSRHLNPVETYCRYAELSNRYVVAIEYRNAGVAYLNGATVHIDPIYMHRIAESCGVGTLAVDTVSAAPFYVHIGQRGAKSRFTPRVYTFEDAKAVFKLLLDLGAKAVPVRSNPAREVSLHDLDYAIFQRTNELMYIANEVKRAFPDFVIDLFDVPSNTFVRTRYGIDGKMKIRKLYKGEVPPAEVLAANFSVLLMEGWTA